MTSELLDKRMQENLQIISKLRLLDDDLMNLVFDKNIEATELLLNIILQRTDLKVLEVVTQREYKNSMAGGRSITIDIYAKDSDEKIYDVEVQRADRGADFHRARFHSSMMDTRMLKEKQDFKDIYDSYVIFITENDVIGAGLSLYHIDRMMQGLKRAGKLKNLKGLIVGKMTQMHDNTIPFGKNAYEIIQQIVKEYDYPKIFGANIGHIEEKNNALIIGEEMSFEINNNIITTRQLC
jgi:hypothetical protein